MSHPQARLKPLYPVPVPVKIFHDHQVPPDNNIGKPRFQLKPPRKLAPTFPYTDRVTEGTVLSEVHEVVEEKGTSALGQNILVLFCSSHTPNLTSI